jgi:hypothetical protein
MKHAAILLLALLVSLCAAHAADVDSLLGKAAPPTAVAAVQAAEPFYVYA